MSCDGVALGILDYILIKYSFWSMEFGKIKVLDIIKDFWELLWTTYFFTVIKNLFWMYEVS